MNEIRRFVVCDQRFLGGKGVRYVLVGLRRVFETINHGPVSYAYAYAESGSDTWWRSERIW